MNLRIQVQKDSIKYNYIFNEKETNIPLNLGTGKYTIKILKLIKDIKYIVTSKYVFKYNEEVSEDILFTQSINRVDWLRNKEIGMISNKLLTNKKYTDKEKSDIIYRYIVKNIKYDYEKAEDLDKRYIPQIKETVREKKGICYDYASLYSCLMRYNNIPSKLVTGYTRGDSGKYHAWNEVKIGGVWRVQDLTYDAIHVQNNINVSKYKDKSKYIKDKEY